MRDTHVSQPKEPEPPPATAAPRAGETTLVALLARHVHATVVLLALAVLATGLFLPPLIAQDSARDAVMAMRMHFENDWIHLIKDGRDYLDKPHLLFWSAMVGFRLFGVHDWSYRLVSVLVTVLGAWSTFGLGRRLYDDTAGKIAAVMFITSYAIVLGAHDVRMDALLTGFVAFGLWQLVTYVDTGRARPLVLGALGVGLAFSAKGMIAVAVSGVALLFHLWGRNAWRRLWSWKLALGIVVFFVTISPILYSYYVQFDLHPEKVVEGRTGVSGVKFILLGQSVERLAGGKGARHSGDVLFLFHTLIWAFLPWSLLTFAAWAHRFRALVRGRWRAFHAQEQLTFLGAFVSIAFLSFSRYKLAHYLNVFFPLLAVFTGGYVAEAYRDGRWSALAALRKTQNVVIAVLLVLALVVLNGWAFPPRNGWVVAGALVLGGLLALGFRLEHRLLRVWVPSALAMCLVNFVQNANYQPWLGELQFGSRAVALLEQELDWSRTYFLEGRILHPVQFYTRRVIPGVDLVTLRTDVAEHGAAFLIVPEKGRTEVREAGIAHEVRGEYTHCRAMMMKPAVLNPRTRLAETCEPIYVLKVGAQPP